MLAKVAAGRSLNKADLNGINAVWLKGFHPLAAG